MLAADTPHIKEKMDLDIQVQKLRLLKSNYLSEDVYKRQTWSRSRNQFPKRKLPNGFMWNGQSRTHLLLSLIHILFTVA